MKYTLKEAFLGNEEKEDKEGKLSTKGFGKHGQSFPQDKQKLRMSDDDIENALKDLDKKEAKEPKKVFKKPVDKSTFKLGKLEPELNKDVPLEKPSDDPKVSQTNKELSKFKSILEDEEMYEGHGLDKEKPETPFDDAFKKHQGDEDKKEKEEKLKKLDEPFNKDLDECGCPGTEPVIDRSKDGLSADVLSDDDDEEFGPTEFVVIKLGDQENGLNVETGLDKTIEYGAPGSPDLNEEDTDTMEIKPEEYDEELMENMSNFFGEK